jgi:hypothetical protein
VNHLGRWLSALVDGELDGTERDRVLNHVAGCAACRREATAMRALKRRLTALGDTCGESPIAGRLIELARDDQGTAAAGAGFGATSWSAAACDPRPGRGVRQTRPGWKIATGSATGALLAIGVIAFLLGNVSAEPPAPKITPSVDSYLLQHSRDWPGEEPAGSTPSGLASGGQAGGAPYWTHQLTMARLDPHRPGTVQLGALAEPIASPAGAGPGAGPMASATASPAPATSRSASPAASPPASDGRSHKHSASRSTK